MVVFQGSDITVYLYMYLFYLYIYKGFLRYVGQGTGLSIDIIRLMWRIADIPYDWT